MFVVRRIEHGFFADQITVEAIRDGELMTRRLRPDRVVRLELTRWVIAAGDRLHVRLPRGQAAVGRMLDAADLEMHRLKRVCA